MRFMQQSAAALLALNGSAAAQTAVRIADNPQMTAIYEADQSARGDPSHIDWAAVRKADAARREGTRELLAKGTLHTAIDYNRAAFVFQHGDTANDYLLAHTLAIIATANGDRRSTWIASATLVRYLQKIGQKQIYGTQYLWADNKPVTQEPYDRTVIADALRGELQVPDIAAQEQERLTWESVRPSNTAPAFKPDGNKGTK